MKRLTLLLLGLALGVSATADAQGLTMQMSNGWAFQFSGNVNAFWTFSHEDSSAATGRSRTYSNVRTGLLPAFATFEARGKEAGMNLAAHIGFAPQIQNGGNAHDQFGAQIEDRKSTRLNSSHTVISYAVFCLKKKKKKQKKTIKNRHKRNKNNNT